MQETITTILAPAVRAATAYSADLDIVALLGRGRALLIADAQGDGVTLNAKLQSSPGLAAGAGYAVVGSVANGLRTAADNNVKLAAQFTQSGARQVKEVVLILKQLGTIASGDIWLTIETNNSGAPSGSALGTSEKIAAAGVADEFGGVKFTFATPVDLANGTIYHLVLQGDYTASAENQIHWRSNTVASGGNFEANNGSAWSDTATKSLEFLAMQYNFTDLVAFTEVGNEAAIEAKAVDIDAAGGFVRAVCTVAGGSATGSTALLLLALPQYS